jgi:glycolate oxidase iron-sulfur subunit
MAGITDPGSALHPSSLDVSQCVRCGFCLQSCPTYVETGLETESPRGRLYLMRALEEGTLQPTTNVTAHLDMCLQCRNCEAVCPSGVPFGQIMEDARSTIVEGGEAPLAWRARALFLREVIAKPGRFRLFASGLRLVQAAGLQSLAERLPVIGPRAALAPRISPRPFRRTGVVARPDGEVKRTVALLTGCIMPLTYGRVHRATVRVLARNGCLVVAPAAQGCCGALHAHNGDLATARTLARRNIDVFLQAGVEAIIVNSAGCGAAMKEYGQLLRGDAQYAERAAFVSALVRDVSEFLASLPLEPPAGHLEGVVTYQDSCHLAHAQRITRAPRQLLQAVPSLRLAEMATPDRCCGAAGVYALTQPEMSMRLLDTKMADACATGAEYIATSNPGCMAQLEAGLRRTRTKAQVVHPVELLDLAYRPR